MTNSLFSAVSASVHDLQREVRKRYRHRLNFSGTFTFERRSKGCRRLAIVVAGYKPLLWPFTLSRLASFAPPDLDVCLVSPGLYSPELSEWASSRQWSYLSTTLNKLALAQNIAIGQFPQAEWIHKLDEDIFISAGYFDGMEEGFKKIEAEGVHRPGFCAPLLNVNGYSYRLFLLALNKSEEYRQKFGELQSACVGVKAHSDGQACAWLWRQSLPFDEMAGCFADHRFEYSTCPHRFSIGAILLKREMWAAIGGFKASRREAELGIEEEHLCAQCVERSRVMAVLHNVFAGHFAFGPQSSRMELLLPEIEPLLRIAARQ